MAEEAVVTSLVTCACDVFQMAQRMYLFWSAHLSHSHCLRMKDD